MILKDEKELGKDVKRLLKKKGYTQKDFALDFGFNEMTLSRLCSGATQIINPNFLKVLELLGLKLNIEYVESMKVKRRKGDQHVIGVDVNDGLVWGYELDEDDKNFF